MFSDKNILSMVAVAEKVDGRKFNKVGVKKADHEKVTDMVFSQTSLYLFARLDFFVQKRTMFE